MGLEEKTMALHHILEGLDSCLLAFSGGLDSGYLALIANRHVPGRVLCVTLDNPSTPFIDLENARTLAVAHGLDHLVISEKEIPPLVRDNAAERCYFCKSYLFERLKKQAKEEGVAAVLDGENASDKDDHRPGRRAAVEHGIISPLSEAGLTKEDIRALAKQEGMRMAERPPSACLSSRIPTGTRIENDMLARIDRTEELIRERGIRMVRARQDGGEVRIELGKKENTPSNISLVEGMKKDILGLGWTRVTIDPEGYIPSGLRKKRGKHNG